MANRKQKPTFLQAVKGQRFFLIGSFLIGLAWYLQNVALESKKDDMSRLDLYYTLGTQMIYDVTLEAFRTDNTLTHRQFHSDSLWFKNEYFNNAIMEILQRISAIEQLENARDVEKHNSSGNRAKGLTKEAEMARVIDTLNIQANSIATVTNYLYHDRKRFRDELDPVQIQVLVERNKLSEEYDQKYKLYLWLYIFGIGFISCDKALKYLNGESAK